MSHDSERQLIEKYLEKQDEQALQTLIERHATSVYGFVARVIGDANAAEDVTQETFVKIWKNLKKFDLNKSFKAWLFTIAKNTAFDFLKKKKAIPLSHYRKEETESLADQIPDTTPLPSEWLEKRDVTKQVIAALAHLSLTARTVLMLHYKQELSFQEIAEILGESIDTVKSRSRRALIQLKKYLLHQT